MPNYTVRINRDAVIRKFDEAIRKSKTIEDLSTKIAESYFKRAKSNMLREFNQHPVTVELDMGPLGVNISETLDGYGNLFAFLGFYADTKPTESLRMLLENSVTLKKTVYRNRTWYFRVEFPGREEIAAKTPMTWEPDSWAFGIEQGISGLSYFFYKKWAAGRSEMGFQVPYENMEGAEFKPVPYMSEIIGNFRDAINNK